MDKGKYDALMKATQAQLQAQAESNKTVDDSAETEETDTTVNESGETEDIYASMREEMDEDDSSSPKSKPNGVDYNKPLLNQPELDQDYDSSKEDYYIDPNDTPVFEGGPGIARVQLWKKQYGIDNIYHTKILENHYLFRTLNRTEYEQIASLSLDSLTNEELICKTCVLWPLNYNYDKMAKEPAGFPSTLSQIIMENSGFTSEYGIEVL